MTVVLASDVEEFLEAQVQSGACANASELVNDVIRYLRAQQDNPLEATPELEEWLLQAADKPATPLTKSDFEGIRERVKARAKSRIP